MTTFLQLPSVLAKYANEPRWVLWRRELRKGQPTKPPYQSRHPNKHASSTDPSTWANFASTLAAYRTGQADGIGLCLLNSDLAAFDLDDCRDAATGVIEPAARRLVKRAGSYAEITVSGAGLRILVTATGPMVHRKQMVPNANGMSLETYRACPRFITISGNALDPAAQLVDGDALIDAVVAELDAVKQKPKRTKSKRRRKPDLDDIVCNGEQGHFNGDRSRAVWFVINELLRRGDTPEAIAAILLDRSNRISDHIYDQTNPQDYVRRQIEQALTNAKDWINRTMTGKNPILSNVANALLGLRNDPELINALGYDEMQRAPMLLHPVLGNIPDFVPRPIVDADVCLIRERFWEKAD